MYRERPPRAELADFVHCVWTFESEADLAPQPIAPDGRCELIVQRRSTYCENDAGEQPAVLFAGQITKPLTLVATGPVSVIGVRFRPDGARAFAGRALDRFTDWRAPLAEIDAADAPMLLEQARAAPLDDAAAHVEAYVLARVAGAALDPDVRAAVSAMLEGDEPLAPASLSERQWERRFKAHVGVSPRMLQSVLRFRRVFDSIEGAGPPGWVEAALAAGYFDQPQMARDFRRFLGVSARQWVSRDAALAKALTQAPESYKTPPKGER